MQLLSNICDETGLNIEDARLILIDVRPDWESTVEVSNSEAELIRQSARAALPSGNGEIAPVTGMDIDHQQRLIDNASQVLGSPLVLAAMQEIKMVDALHEVKNTVILNTIDRRQAELEIAIKERSGVRQQAYMTAIQDLADRLEKPISVVEEMTADIKANNAQLETLLAQVRAGK
jgi:tetrahydromethanopterin S-methyltransferase subunit H